MIKRDASPVLPKIKDQEQVSAVLLGGQMPGLLQIISDIHRQIWKPAHLALPQLSTVTAFFVAISISFFEGSDGGLMPRRHLFTSRLS